MILTHTDSGQTSPDESEISSVLGQPWLRFSQTLSNIAAEIYHILSDAANIPEDLVSVAQSRPNVARLWPATVSSNMLANML